MKCVRFGIIVFVLAFLFFCLQDAKAQESLTQQSLSIKNSLTHIREQSIALSEELMNAQESWSESESEQAEELTSIRKKLTMSEEERTSLQEKSIRLSSSLMTINRRLSDCYRNIIALETELKTAIRTVVILAAVLLVLILMKVAGYILYFKGIHIPRWLDILL